MSWLLPLLNNLNYWTVFLLMFIEGSVIPAPSELIVPPAAYRAAAGELNIVLVVIVATIGQYSVLQPTTLRHITSADPLYTALPTASWDISAC